MCVTTSTALAGTTRGNGEARVQPFVVRPHTQRCELVVELRDVGGGAMAFPRAFVAPFLDHHELPGPAVMLKDVHS
jgi:hypothetical protein